MRYDHDFRISSEVHNGQLCIKIQRSNGHVLIPVDYWDKLKVQRRKTIINKWRKR